MIRYLYIYLSLLLLILVSYTDINNLPSIFSRIAFLAALILPFIFYKKNKELFFVAFIVFVTISSVGYAISYMPVTGPIILTVLLISTILFSSSSKVSRVNSVALALLIFLTFIINIINSADIKNITYSMLSIVLVTRSLSSSHNTKINNYLSFAFALISLVLSMEFLLVGKDFVNEISVGGTDYIRKGWTDPNYFGCILGIGVLVSIIELILNNNLSFRLRIYYYSTIILSIITIISVASRGALLAILVPVLLIIFRSSIKAKYKLITILLIAFFVVVLYSSHLLDLVIARFMNDAGDAGERTLIWTKKFTAFLEEGTPWSWLFGVGYDRGMNLGYSHPQGFHNDFFAFFIDYGIVGFILFFCFLFYPLLRAKQNRLYVWAIIVYVMLVSLTLEPFSSGSLIYYYFMTYALLLGRGKCYFKNHGY